MAGTGIGIGVSQATTSTPRYRTALAGTASVTRTLPVTGVLEPVDQTTAAFQVAGTVATVPVTEGQEVTAGQTIASLDPTLLQQQVTAAQAALTAAQAKLTADESGQSTSATASPGGAAGSAGSGSTGTSPVTAASTAAVVTSPATGSAGVQLTSVTTGSAPAGSGFTRGGSGSPATGTGASGANPLSSDQQAVVDAQHRADVDLQTAGVALTTAETTCSAGESAPVFPSTAPSTTAPSTTAPTRGGTGPRHGGTGYPGGGSGSTTTTTSPGGAPTTPAPGGSATGGSTPGGASTACASALAQAQAAQQKVAADQQALARAEATLAQLLASQASAAPSPTRPTGAGTGTGTRSGGSQTPSHPAGTAGSAASATRTAPSPAQLASDQATIDSDDASLAQAEQALSAAVLTSPISGTVASVAVTPGETVSARSSTATITIVNSGSYQTTVSLSTAQVQSVRTSDQVSLTIDGQTGTYHGTVSSIGPVDTSNSSFTYPVTIAITSPTGQLPAGSTTRTTIDVAGATDALVVPTSAVHTAGPALSFVYLDDNGKETRQKVTVGVVGPIYTQISSGLTRGQAVVLADPSQPVPASNTSATAGGFGGAFRVGGRGAGLGGGGALRNLLRGSAG